MRTCVLFSRQLLESRTHSYSLQPAASVGVVSGGHAGRRRDLLDKRASDTLVVARKLTTSREMLLWMTPSEAPKALQASECSELLDPMRASCWISAQH